jgi:hypothetical protein
MGIKRLKALFLMIRAVATKLSLTPRLLQRGYARVRTVEVSTGFDDAWRNMNETQKAKTIADYSAYESQDWHTLTLEQKRASILHSPIPHLTLVYTISYGPPEINDPYEGYKVFGGVLAICALGISVFAFARSKGTHHHDVIPSYNTIF